MTDAPLTKAAVEKMALIFKQLGESEGDPQLTADGLNAWSRLEDEVLIAYTEPVADAWGMQIVMLEVYEAFTAVIDGHVPPEDMKAAGYRLAKEYHNTFGVLIAEELEL